MEQAKHTQTTSREEWDTLSAERDRLREINRDLLAACKKADTYLAGIRYEPPDGKFEEGDLVTLLQAAIAKAEGS